jgi:hypothetical protein
VLLLRGSLGNGPSNMTTEADIKRVVAAGRALPPAAASYLEDDFVMNLLETVLDYMLQTTVVVAALEYFRTNRWEQIRTLDDIEEVVGRYAEDQRGNTALAVHLWGYRLWTRAQQLRDLARYFRSIGVIDSETLRSWAMTSDFKRDFAGRVKGLGPAVYQWLVMRQGVDTVKPDVHVRRFAEAAVGHPLGDGELIALVSQAAQRLGIPAREFDWRIWEASRGGALPYPGPPTPGALTQ